MRRLCRRIPAVFLLVILVILLGLGAPAAAAKQRVSVAAQEWGAYNLEERIFTAEGDVQVTIGDVKLEGDRLIANFDSGEVVLEGAVRWRQGEQELGGQRLIYDLEAGEGRFEEALAELTAPAGIIYVSGRAIHFDEERYLVNAGEFTTCELPHSHYRLAAKELEYYPGEKVVIRGVTYYEGKIPLFYWPYLVIPLDWDGDQSLFNLPVFGYGEHEGYYVKNTFNYYLSPNAAGNIFLDLYTRLGVGVGLRHNYKLEKLGEGSLYFWGIPTISEPAYRGSFAHKLTSGSWDFTTSTELENTWVREQLTSSNRLTLNLPKIKAEGWFNYAKTPAKTVKEQKVLGAKWAQELTDHWDLQLEGSLTQQTASEVLRLVDTLAATTYRQGRHKLSLTVQQQHHPDLLKSSSQPWRSLQRIPELKWEVGSLNLLSLPMDLELTAGRYREQPSNVSGSRLSAELGLGSKVWRPISGGTLTVQGDLHGALYSGGQAQAWAYGRTTYTQSLGSLELSGTYRRREVWGSTPFRFDAQSKLDALSLRLSYSQGSLRASASTSYNLLTKRFSGLTLQARLKPAEQWTLDLYGNYDLNTRTLTRVVPMVEYEGDMLGLMLGARYRPHTQELERVDARISFPLGSTWQISYDGIYEPGKRAFAKGQIGITKDLHCRELTLSYDHVSQRVALQLTINAFPTLPIGWDSEEGISLFDLEDVTEIIGVKE